LSRAVEIHTHAEVKKVES